ncbi:peptidase MA family metallohydrolase [Balneola sp. MJW-20]|uniref:peptidase MA family metallohydrolase n=1 Tax=Gracilimonas aurantiaca TaxID=3234185 RepID=UPI003466A7E5
MMKRILLGIALAGLLIWPEVQAQYYSFGKNRVQYEDFEWRFIQSTHFDVYYYGDKNYKLAEFAAKSVESAYRQLSEDFDHEISARIPLIIYDSHNDFSQTNVVALPIEAEGIGGVTDKFKNRMTVPFDGDYKDFRRTLHHELVHAVFNDMFYGGSVQSIIRNNINLVFPLWFEEGLAEYMALGWDSNTDMYIRDAVINNYLPPLNRLSGYYAYRGGQSFWNFVVENYGREKISEILQRIKNTRNVGLGLTQSLGLEGQDLSDEWMEYLKKRYYPEVAVRESNGDVGTQLTERAKFGTYNTSPSISPQGDKVAFITNKRSYFDIVVISTINSEKLKTLIKGQDNPEFEELNILNPNLTWSPDGSKVAASSKSQGKDELAIIDYRSGKVDKFRFPQLDAIGSVAWSPDGKKIAFDGNVGPYQDIFLYDIDSRELTNLTKDFFSDMNPAWGSNSQEIYFNSYRGDRTQLGRYNLNHDLLLDRSMYQSDLYKIRIGENNAVRLTKTNNWNEWSPKTTGDGRMVYISDLNGIQNIYELNLQTLTSTPLTNFLTGVSQISISNDGSRLAYNSINEGYLDIFLMRSPFNRAKQELPSLNYWAKRRAQETQEQRVPAIAYADQMFRDGLKIKEEARAVEEVVEQEQRQDDSENIDFRNYVFADDVIADTTIEIKDENTFEPEDNYTNDGRYQPRDYRLAFSTDISYNPTFVASTYGSAASTQFIISDLLGDHQLAFGTNFVLDLRNSDYTIQYAYLKNRMNYIFNFFHTANRFQTFSGEILRFRTYGLTTNFQYPINKFKRIDFGVAMIGVARDYSIVPDGNRFFIGGGPFLGQNVAAFDDQRALFLYPEVTFTDDKTLPGFITPAGGSRYSVGISGSPGVGNQAPTFISALGDFRKYFNLGYQYTFALRYSGGVSLGGDSQNYFMGGRLGWINRRFSENELSFDQLVDNFFSVPALPLRGYAYNAIYGDRFSLINAEFRFPFFAAVIPGALPIIPLYNLTGVAFLDVGTAWGRDIRYGLQDANGNQIINDSGLDFKVAKPEDGFYQIQTQNGAITASDTYLDGDILIGGGFGIRTILFGLPFRYDVGWPYERSGFGGNPIHYFSIGIDF